MYWQKGIGFVLLWVAAVTAVLCALGAYWHAGSGWGALAFLATAAVLAPPGQELIAAARHKMAPAKAAFMTVITLVPIGVGFVIVDGVAKLDREAVKLGFASAGQWARAKDLKLATPQALAAHDESERKNALAAKCRQAGASPPIECYEAGHRRVALAMVEALLGGDELAGLTRQALERQRKKFLELDKDCKDLLDRIDEDAMPIILGNRSALVGVAAAMWARNFSMVELEQLLARSKAGGPSNAKADIGALDRKLAARGPAIGREIDQVLQSWARRIVMEEPGWRSLVKGRTPLTRCRPAEVAARS